MTSKKKQKPAETSASSKRARRQGHHGAGTVSKRIQEPKGRWVMQMDGRGRKRMVFEENGSS